MNADDLISALAHSGETLGHALEGVPADEARWRPAEERWSVLEIACHLLDEEREDFRARIALVLEDPQAAWPPIDPEGWVGARGYRERDFAQTVCGLRAERADSIAWLRTQAKGDWTRAHAHPLLGELRAGDLLASWAAHDQLHLQQVARTRAAFLAQAVAPFSTRYAMP